MTAAVRKSLTDLTRRRARSALTTFTLALAVASVGIFAVPDLLRQSMEQEMRRGAAPDVTLSMPPVALSAERLAALEALPNVAALEPRSVLATRVWVGGRREPAIVVGVRDFARQRADVVFLEAGRVPDAGAVLTDRANASAKSFDAAAARLIAADGSVRTLPVSGVGRNLTAGEDDPSNDWITFYASTETVAALSASAGYTSLAVRLHDPSRPAAERAVAAVRDELRATTEFAAFDDLPLIRAPGTYPGQDSIENLAGLLNTMTVLALVSALVLVSSTMTTLIGEQTSEIATMKAIGARARDLRRLYLRTALVLGAAGGLVGSVLGVLLAYALASFFGSLLYVDVAFGVSVPVVAAGLALGLLGPALAALPAVRRAVRLPLLDALRASGSATATGGGRLDALLRRAGSLPRSAQIGLRAVTRRGRRSLATITQIALAVATLLALLALGAGVAQTTRGWFDDLHFDTWVQAVASEPFDAGAERVITSTPGVGEAQGWLQNAARVNGREVAAWGLPARPLMEPRVTGGRWHSAAELERGAPVAVLGATLAKQVGVGVGDRITLETSNGPAGAEVIGISANQAENGDVVFLPLSTLQAFLGSPGAVNSYWIGAGSDDHAAIDAVTTRVEDRLAANGHPVVTLVTYDVREQQVQANAALTTMITVLGLLIVAISMVALVNTMTMAVLERTREIGMLRSVGARARDVRRIFATEGLVLAVAGWCLGVPLGYLFARAFVWATREAIGLDVAFTFPVSYMALALLGTLLLALAVMLAPLRRAVRFKPGDALRCG